MPTPLTADEFIKQLKKLSASAVAQSHAHLKADKDDIVIGVRMGQVFALAKE